MNGANRRMSARMDTDELVAVAMIRLRLADWTRVAVDSLSAAARREQLSTALPRRAPIAAWTIGHDNCKSKLPRGSDRCALQGAFQGACRRDA